MKTAADIQVTRMLSHSSHLYVVTRQGNPGHPKPKGQGSVLPSRLLREGGRDDTSVAEFWLPELWENTIFF